MQKKLLVIGGSYFIGRVFCLLASRLGEYDLTVVNRGKYKLNKDNITEHICDRHDIDALRKIVEGNTYDAIIDFCAYLPGDCADVTEVLHGHIRQYIEISSCAIYAPSDLPRDENSTLETKLPENNAELYSYNKILLESELREACGLYGLPYTILRPSFVYGPFNYAPRESYYFKLLLANEPIPIPVDSVSQFQFIFVKDVATAVVNSISNELAYDNSYILAAPEKITYSVWNDFLLSLGTSFTTEDISVRQVLEQNVPLPFPLDQNELFNGAKAERELALAYTPFNTGMSETFEVYRKAFG